MLSPGMGSAKVEEWGGIEFPIANIALEKLAKLGHFSQMLKLTILEL